MSALNQINIQSGQDFCSFYQMTRGSVENVKVILIGYTETRSDHFYSIATLLNALATDKDLMLIEYLDRGKERDCSHPVMRVMNALEYYGFRKKIHVQGWDNTALGTQISRMLTGQIPINYQILIEQRNDVMAASVLEAVPKFRKMFVLAGTAHFCIPPNKSYPLHEKVLFYPLLTPYHQKLFRQLESVEFTTLVPLDSERVKKISDFPFTDLYPESSNGRIVYISILIFSLMLLFFVFSKSEMNNLKRYNDHD